jgi:ligand-binding sensor domain-containing protein
MRIFLTIFCLLNFSAAFAQSDLTIGQWKSHLPFNTGISVTQSSDRIFYATPQAVLAIDKADLALERISKVEGLTKVGVSLVKYNQESKILVVVFDNGAIDLLTPEGIVSLPSIPASNILLGEKRVNEVFMANDSIAYLAANFGLSTLNLKTGLFPNTVKTPFEVKAVRIFNGLIYIATQEGIYTADPTAGYNVDDFSNWEWLGGERGFPQDYSSEALDVYNGKLYLGVNDSLYVYDGDTAQYFYHLDGFFVKYLSSEGQHLLAGHTCNTGCVSKVIFLNENGYVRENPFGCVDLSRYAIEDEQGTIWYANSGKTFRANFPGQGGCVQISANSPVSTNIAAIDVADNGVWVAAGGLDLSFIAIGLRDGFYWLADGFWENRSIENEPALAGVSDFIDIKVHPSNGKVYGAAYWDALVEFDPVTKEFQVFNETNSDGKLDFAVQDPTRTRVLGLAFDAAENLWMTNNNAPSPLVVRRKDGTWENYALSCSNERSIYKIVVDRLGYKWMNTFNSNIGIIVFDEGDPADPADDRCKIINASNSVLPTNEVNALEVDRDGAIWVGTKNGAAVFQCDPFSDCSGTLPFVEVDGFGANLLEEQDVRCVAVDGANRKWFGTSAGVFVMSPEGTEQIAHFTEENSPLFSNVIIDIDFNEATGEAFIGTANGLISYRGEATTGKAFHSGVLVYPNPVRPDYEGPIAIKGLAEDATVKITDVSGQLVYETQALGGQAIWNGRDYNDRKVNTGVYLVFATSRNQSSPSVAVAKVLVVN